MKNRKQQLLKGRGIALVQGLIVAGFVAAASALVVNYTSLQQANSNRIIKKGLSDSVASIVTNLFSTQPFCESTLSGNVFDAGGGNFDNVSLLDPQGRVVLAPGTTVGNVTVDNIIVSYPANPWPANIGGNNAVRLSGIDIFISYIIDGRRFENRRSVDPSQLPMVVKDGAGNFVACDHSIDSAVTEAATEACTAMGGVYNPFPANPNSPKCDLSQTITGTDPALAGASERASGLLETNNYYNSRFLLIDPQGVDQEFQVEKGLRVGRLEVQDSQTADALLTIKQMRETIQASCAGMGPNVFGIFKGSGAGITCQNMVCNQGEQLVGIDPSGAPVCRDILGNGGLGCPGGSGDYYRLTVDASNSVQLECCTPVCNDSGSHPLGTLYPEQNQCGQCMGTATNKYYQCSAGAWQELGDCEATDTASCSSGSAINGEVACCGSFPSAACSPPPPSPTSYLCLDQVWTLNGSCSTTSGASCTSGNTASGNSVCCDNAPTSVCDADVGGGLCSALVGSSCTADSQCGAGGQCNGMTSGGGACEVSANGPNSCAILGNAGAGAVPAGEECNSSENFCHETTSRSYPISTLCGNLFSQNNCDNSRFIKVAHSCSGAGLSHCAWNPSGGGTAGTCGCTPSPSCTDGNSCSTAADCGGAPNTCGGGVAPTCVADTSSPITGAPPRSLCVSAIDADCVCSNDGSWLGLPCSSRYDDGGGTPYECMEVGGTPDTCSCATASCVSTGDSVAEFDDVTDCCVPALGFAPPNETQYICDNGGSGVGCTCGSSSPSFNTYTCNSGTWSGAGSSCSGPDDSLCSSGTANSSQSICCGGSPSSTCDSGGAGAMGRYQCTSTGWNYQMAEVCASSDPSCSSGAHGVGANFCCNTTPTSTCSGGSSSSSGPPPTMLRYPCLNGSYGLGYSSGLCSGSASLQCSGFGTVAHGDEICCTSPPNDSNCQLESAVCRPYAGTYAAEPATNNATGCLNGTFDNTIPADSATQWNWSCTVSGSGSDATCSANRTTGSSFIRYQCGSGGWGIMASPACSVSSDDAGCSTANVTGSPSICCSSPPDGSLCNGSSVINGACNTSYTGTYSTQPALNTANGCNSGTFTEVTDNDHSWRWRCDGSGGGSNSTCSATRGRRYRCNSLGDFNAPGTSCNSISSACGGPLITPQGSTLCCDSTPSDAYCSNTPPSSTSSSGSCTATCPGGVSSCATSVCPAGNQCSAYAGNCPATHSDCQTVCTTNHGNVSCYAGGGADRFGAGCF